MALWVTGAARTTPRRQSWHAGTRGGGGSLLLVRMYFLHGLDNIVNQRGITYIIK